MVRKEELHSGLQEEECLNSSENNLDECFENGLSPLWTIMQKLHEELW